MTAKQFCTENSVHVLVNAGDIKDLGKMNDLEIINQTKKIGCVTRYRHQATFLRHFTLNLLKLTGWCVAKQEASAFTLRDARVPETPCTRLQLPYTSLKIYLRIISPN